MKNKETGEQLEDNDYRRLQLGKFNNPFVNCDHCYCGEDVFNNKKHKICCICGHRVLDNPITCEGSG